MNGLYEISVKGKSGFIKIDEKNKAKQILPCEYDKILLLQDYRNIKVIQNQKEGIFNVQSEQFVLPCNYENLKLYADKDNIIFCDARFQKRALFLIKMEMK